MCPSQREQRIQAPGARSAGRRRTHAAAQVSVVVKQERAARSRRPNAKELQGSLQKAKLRAGRGDNRCLQIRRVSTTRNATIRRSPKHPRQQVTRLPYETPRGISSADTSRHARGSRVQMTKRSLPTQHEPTPSLRAHGSCRAMVSKFSYAGLLLSMLL